MGWNFEAITREELVRELTKSFQYDGVTVTKLGHYLIDDILWSIEECTTEKIDLPHFGMKAGEKARFIRCDLLWEHPEGFNHRHYYEKTSLDHYSCPWLFLDIVPGGSPEWREKVLNSEITKGYSRWP